MTYYSHGRKIVVVDKLQLAALALATAKADALETANAKLRAERDAMRKRLKEFQGATVDELLCLREALWAERVANAEFRSAVEAGARRNKD